MKCRNIILLLAIHSSAGFSSFRFHFPIPSLALAYNVRSSPFTILHSVQLIMHMYIVLYMLYTCSQITRLYHVILIPLALSASQSRKNDCQRRFHLQASEEVLVKSVKLRLLYIIGKRQLYTSLVVSTETNREASARGIYNIILWCECFLLPAQFW